MFSLVGMVAVLIVAVTTWSQVTEQNSLLKKAGIEPVSFFGSLRNLVKSITNSFKDQDK